MGSRDLVASTGPSPSVFASDGFSGAVTLPVVALDERQAVDLGSAGGMDSSTADRTRFQRQGALSAGGCGQAMLLLEHPDAAIRQHNSLVSPAEKTWDVTIGYEQGHWLVSRRRRCTLFSQDERDRILGGTAINVYRRPPIFIA